METTEISHDIRVLCARALSFPHGVLQAYQHIEQLDPAFCKRDFYGLSRGNKDGGIDYWAAVEEHERGESERTALEPKTIPKGTYAAIEIRDFRKDMPAIAGAFRQLLRHPRMDESAYCVEKYINDSVICMVRLKN